jgi:pyrroline-5-carboxylate reductase
MLTAGLVAADNILVMEPDPPRQQYLQTSYNVGIAENPAEVTTTCTIIIVAVKPQVLQTVLLAYRELLSDDHLVISIAAGTPLRTLEQSIGSGIAAVRVMPNTPCLVLEGASALSGNEYAGPEDMAAAMEIFSAVGSCVELPESSLDAVTGLSGSGPGYVFTFIEALVDGGVLAGLPRPIAEQLALQTIYGSAKLALETGEPAAVLKGKVTSPAGTTITGIQVLEESGLRGAVMTAVEAATERSKELGQ